METLSYIFVRYDETLSGHNNKQHDFVSVPADVIAFALEWRHEKGANIQTIVHSDLHGGGTGGGGQEHAELEASEFCHTSAHCTAGKYERLSFYGWKIHVSAIDRKFFLF